VFKFGTLKSSERHLFGWKALIEVRGLNTALPQKKISKISDPYQNSRRATLYGYDDELNGPALSVAPPVQKRLVVKQISYGKCLKIRTMFMTSFSRPPPNPPPTTHVKFSKRHDHRERVFRRGCFDSCSGLMPALFFICVLNIRYVAARPPGKQGALSVSECWDSSSPLPSCEFQRLNGIHGGVPKNPGFTCVLASSKYRTVSFAGFDIFVVGCTGIGVSAN